MEAFGALLREALLVTAVLCFPILLAATAVGTCVAVVQAATQIQEQTLTLLPKLCVVGVLVACGGAFGMHLCAQLFADAVNRLPAIVHGPL